MNNAAGTFWTHLSFLKIFFEIADRGTNSKKVFDEKNLQGLGKLKFGSVQSRLIKLFFDNVLIIIS